MVLEEEYATLFIDMQKPKANTWEIVMKIRNHLVLRCE